MYKILVSLDQAMDDKHCLKSQLGILNQWPKQISQTKGPKPSAEAQILLAIWWFFTSLLYRNKGISATTGSKQQHLL